MDSKTIEVRQVALRDLPEIESWYDGLLPSADLRGLGFVAHRGSELIACGWFVGTYTRMCFWEFVETNPDCQVYLRAKAVRLLTDHVLAHAKRRGFRVIMGFTPESKTSLLKMYERMGGFVDSKPYRIVARGL